VSRPPLAYLAASVVMLAGLAGLIRGAVPQSAAAPSPSSSSGGGIVVGGAYVRQPANGINAAAYFTVYNTSGQADQLQSVQAGAGAQTMLHQDEPNGTMKALPAGVTVPAHGKVVLTPGKLHVMIEQLYGPLKPGQSVNLELSFAHAGTVLVVAPVIAILAPAPTGAAAPTPSATVSK